MAKRSTRSRPSLPESGGKKSAASRGPRAPRSAKVRSRSVSPDLHAEHGERMGLASAVAPSPPATRDDTVMLRTLFWHNVARELLSSMAAHQAQSGEDFAGRFGIILATGERVSISEVHPLFACGVPGTDSERELSIAVECTVFRVITPEGESLTFPLHEVRAIHALTDELAREIEKSQKPDTTPFGFAAFAAMAAQRKRNERRAERQAGPARTRKSGTSAASQESAPQRTDAAPPSAPADDAHGAR
jgi:hypothetical protein